MSSESESLKEHIKSLETKKQVEEKISIVDNQIKNEPSEEEKNRKLNLENDKPLQEYVNSYQESLAVLDKQYHHFEHRFFDNLNKYPNTMLNTKLALDNNPDLIEKTDFSPHNIIRDNKNEKQNNKNSNKKNS